MTRIFFSLLLCSSTLFLAAQTLPSKRSIKKEVRAWQTQQNLEFQTAGKSPLDSADILDFKALPFYPINFTAYQVVRWERCEDSTWFEMTSTTARRPIYRKYATLYFTHTDGQTYALTAYQSKDLIQVAKYENYLFVPFGDASNGTVSYGGGRYVEVTRGEWVLDFNKAYNPYCAYSGRYSCPKVPVENILDIPILAGTQYDGGH
ncbi:MAG: DUF1684 domain-containing protein [Schleiferiaceae bacterium]|nr:DUF1684 domain-containing protein [Schleiferiaceae bacterium]